MPPPDAERPTSPTAPRPGPSRPTRVSPKGQVTVPKPVRDYLGLGAGCDVEFEVARNGDVVLRKRPDSARPLRGLLAAYAPEAAETDGVRTGVRERHRAHPTAPPAPPASGATLAARCRD